MVKKLFKTIVIYLCYYTNLSLFETVHVYTPSSMHIYVSRRHVAYFNGFALSVG